PSVRWRTWRRGTPSLRTRFPPSPKTRGALTQATGFSRPAETTTHDPAKPRRAACPAAPDLRPVLRPDDRADAQAPEGRPADDREPQEGRPGGHQRRPVRRGRGDRRRHGGAQDRRQRQGQGGEVPDHRPGAAGRGERRYWMKRTLLWRGLLILASIVASVAAASPPNNKIHLGLDLRGGMHLVLQVHTEDALRAETDVDMERLAQQVKDDTKGKLQIKPQRTGDTRFVVPGLAPEAKTSVLH